MSGAKHTPGPWFAVQHGTEKACWMVMRDLRDSGGRCEFLKDANGTAAEFPSREAALLAIPPRFGPWRIEDRRRTGHKTLRVCRDNETTGIVEYLKNSRGSVARFRSADTARAAIAKATGRIA